MNQNERDRKHRDPAERGVGNEVPSRKRSENDADLQREGNLGNERNRSEGDQDRSSGNDRDEVER